MLNVLLNVSYNETDYKIIKTILQAVKPKAIYL